jgi:hypothetical protein
MTFKKEDQKISLLELIEEAFICADVRHKIIEFGEGDMYFKGIDKGDTLKADRLHLASTGSCIYISVPTKPQKHKRGKKL